MQDLLQTAVTVASGAFGLKALELTFALTQKLLENRAEPQQSIQDRLSNTMLKRIDQMSVELEHERAQCQETLEVERQMRREVERENDTLRQKCNEEFQKRVQAETDRRHIEAKLAIYADIDRLLNRRFGKTGS